MSFRRGYKSYVRAVSAMALSSIVLQQSAQASALERIYSTGSSVISAAKSFSTIAKQKTKKFYTGAYFTGPSKSNVSSLSSEPNNVSSLSSEPNVSSLGSEPNISWESVDPLVFPYERNLWFKLFDHIDKKVSKIKKETSEINGGKNLRRFYKAIYIVEAVSEVLLSSIVNGSNALGDAVVSVLKASSQWASQIPEALDPVGVDQLSMGEKILRDVAGGSALGLAAFLLSDTELAEKAFGVAMSSDVIPSLIRWEMLHFSGKKVKEFFEKYPTASFALAMSLILWGGYELFEGSSFLLSNLLPSVAPEFLNVSGIIPDLMGFEQFMRKTKVVSTFLKPAMKVSLKGLRSAISSAVLSLYNRDPFLQVMKSSTSHFKSGMSKGLYPMMQKEFLKALSPLTKEHWISPEKIFTFVKFSKTFAGSVKQTISSDMVGAQKEMFDFLSGELIDLLVDGGLSLENWKSIEKIFTAAGMVSPFLKSMIQKQHVAFSENNSSFSIDGSNVSLAD